MNNKTNIEEDIKKINDYIHDWQDNLTDEDGYSIETLDEDSENFIKAIENILADREINKAKANKYDALVEKMKEKKKWLDEEGYYEFNTLRDSDKCEQILQELIPEEE